MFIQYNIFTFLHKFLYTKIFLLLFRHFVFFNTTFSHLFFIFFIFFVKTSVKLFILCVKCVTFKNLYMYIKNKYVYLYVFHFF